MVAWILKKILGSKNQRELKRLAPIIRRINEFDEQFKSLSDDELRAKTANWKEEISKMSDLQEQWTKLDEILPEAFAVVKNAARRLKDQSHSFTVCDQPIVWDMVHFDVQLLGGIVLHRGRIAEMATGEGKTLVATLPLYLNAHWPRRAPGDGERLPGPSRRGMDGPTLQFSGTNGRLHSTRSGTRRSSRTVRDGHHLRYEQ
jgi:preprotein translocase subunit SecA